MINNLPFFLSVTAVVVGVGVVVSYWGRNSSTPGQDDSKPLSSLQHLSADNAQKTHKVGGGRGPDIPHPPTPPAPQADAGHAPAGENALAGIR